MYEYNGYVYGGNPINEIKVTEVKVLKDMMMILTFSSGEKRLFDAMILEGPVFEQLKDEDVFLSAAIDHGVVTWKDGEIDCAPEFMYDHSYEYALQYLDNNNMRNLSEINLIKVDQVLDAIEAARKYNFIKRITVFGSALRDDCTEDSDIDLCLDVNGDIDTLDYYNAAKDIRKACNHNCDILVRSRLNDLMEKEILKTGVDVYVS